MDKILRAVPLFLLITSTMFTTACSGDGSSPASASTTPDGTYYLPEQDLGGGDFTPETITEIKDGVITDYSVHNGAVVKTEFEYTQTENKFSTASREEEIFDCNGLPVKIESEAGFDGVEFKKSGNNLQVTQDGETFTLVSAKQEDIERITSLPACNKQ